METPNYYAILPASIRYATDISDFQKLLYAEITALTHKSGYCFAQSSYFAELYGKTRSRISVAISDLANKGYLVVEISKEDGNHRKIYIGACLEKQTSLLRKTNKGLLRKTNKGLLRKTNIYNSIKNNSTRKNNKNNITQSVEDQKIQKVAEKKKSEKELFLEKVNSVLESKKLSSEISVKNQARVALWFGKELLDMRLIKFDMWVEKITKRLAGGATLEDILEAMWRNTHNKRSSGVEDASRYFNGKIRHWSLGYLFGDYKSKCPIEVSLQREINITANEERQLLAEKIQHLLPTISKYENKTSTGSYTGEGEYNVDREAQKRRVEQLTA